MSKPNMYTKAVIVIAFVGVMVGGLAASSIYYLVFKTHC